MLILSGLAGLIMSLFIAGTDINDGVTSFEKTCSQGGRSITLCPGSPRATTNTTIVSATKETL